MDNIEALAGCESASYDTGMQKMVSYPLNDTIYNIEKENLIPKYVIKFEGKNVYSGNFTNPLSPDEFCELNQDKSYYRWIKDVRSSDKGLFFAFNYDKTYFVKYSKKGEINIYSEFIKGLPVVSSSAVGYTETGLIYCFSASTLKQYADDNKIINDSLYNSISEEDNPVLIFVDADKF